MTYYEDATKLIGRTPLVRINRLYGDSQAIVLAKQDAVQGLASIGHYRGDGLVAGQFRDHFGRRVQGVDAADAQVVGVGGHVGMLRLRGGVRAWRPATKKPPGSLAAFGVMCARKNFRTRATLPPPVAWETSIQNRRRRVGCSRGH